MKRVFDLVVAAAAVALLAPLMLAIGIAVRLGLGSPVWFVQERPGRHGVPFRMIKFRTMRDALDADGRPLPDGERLTGPGHVPAAPPAWTSCRSSGTCCAAT